MTKIPFTQDFKICSLDEIIRGIFYPESNRSLVFAGQHESLTEIYDTCGHETIHGILDYISYMDKLNLDTNHEHYIIQQMCWAEESLV